MTKVSIVKVAARNREQVAAGVRRAIELAGGLGGLIHADMRVMIKPNMVAPPTSADAGACTNPLVCQAVADVVRELGARPVIAESSARGADTEAAYRIMGYDDLRQQGYEVVDAIIGQEGIGPLLGIPVEMGLVLAGRDLVAVDAIAGRIMGFAPEEVPITVTAANRGLGTMTDARIEVTGEPVATVARRFVRAEEDHRIDAEGINILYSEGTCTACRNGLLSSLFDMRADGSLARARGLTVVAGPTPLPAGIPQEFLVGIGSCALPEAKGLSNYVKGCPPNNVDIIRALTAERIGEG